MRKEICIIISNAFSYAGTENICNFMTDSLGEDYDITIVSLDGVGKPFYPFMKVKKIITLNNNKLKILRTVFLARTYGKDGVFIISMGKLSVLYGFFSLLAFNSLKKTVACEHVSIGSFSSKIKMLKMFFLKRYQKVVTLTERDLIFLSNNKVDAIKINNPIFEKKFSRYKRTKTALAIGRLENQKGFDRLLQIWSKFTLLQPEWKLKIAGEGIMRNQLTELITQLKIEESVVLLGKVKNVDELYKTCDVFLMTSRYEGLPMVLLEAKSWSLPIIAFDCQTGPREVINHGLDGYLIDDGNQADFVEAILNISLDDDKFFSMSSACNETIDKFSAKNISKEWKQLADSLSD